MSLDKITGLRVKIDEDTYSDPYEFRTFAENVLLNRETDSDTVEEVFNKHLFRNGLANVDLNDVITPGFYGCATTANSATITNKPMGLNDTEFVMQVLQIDASGNKIQQILTSMNSGAIWTRSRAASSGGGYIWTIWTGSYGASSVIPSNSDLDNYIEPGVYVSQNASVSATITNTPTTSYSFVVLVFSLGKDTTGRVQFVLQAGAGRSKMWTRTRSGGTWTQWVNYNFFGLAQFQIAADTDLNTLFTTGTYRCASNATAATLVNCPTNVAFIMDIRHSSSASYVYQIIIPQPGDCIYIRQCKTDGTDFDAWQKYSASSSMINIASGTDLNNLFESGATYVSPDSATTNSLINCPSTGSGGVLKCYEHTGSRYIQIWINGGTLPGIWIRAYRSTGSSIEWTRWKKQDMLSWVGESIPSNANLNDYVETGLYRCTSETIAKSLTNCPINVSFVMQVRYSISAQYIIQTIYTYTADRSYRRRITLSNGAFSSAGAWNWIQNYKVVTAYDENNNVTVGTLDNVIQYCTTNFNPADVIHSFYFQGGTNALYGTAAFTVLSRFTSANYGWMMCFSDRQTQTPIHIAYSSGNYIVNRLEAPTDNSYLKQLTTSDNLFTLAPGHYRIYNALPTNIPNDIDPAQKYGYVKIYYENSYTYYDLVAGTGDFINQGRWIGWKKGGSNGSTISWKRLDNTNDPNDLTSSTDLNTITVPGTYRASTDTISGSIVNKPSGIGNAIFILQVYSCDSSNSNILQTILSGASGGQFWIRRYASNTWDPWTNINNFYLPANGFTKGTDLNTITNIGNYRVTTVDLAKTLLNCPTEQPFILDVRWSRTSIVKMQILYEYMGKHIFIRSFTKGTDWTDCTWGEWYDFESKPAIQYHMDTLSIVNQPQNIIVTPDELISLSVTAKNKASSPTTTYQWQYSSNNGSNWSNIPSGWTDLNLINLGGKTDNYYINASGATVSNTNLCYTKPLKLNNGQYLFTGTNTVGTTITRIHACNADGTWIKQLAQQSTGKNAAYSILFTVDDTVPYIIVSTLKNMTDAAIKPIFSSTAYSSTSNLYFAATASRFTNQYRCKITDGTNTVYSQPARVIRKTVINQHPEKIIYTRIGNQITLKINADGQNLNYKWQYLNNGNATYTEVSSATTGYNQSELTFTINSTMNLRKYRCIVAGDGGTEISNTCTIILQKILFIGDSYCEGYSHDGSNDGWAWHCGQYLGLIGTKHNSSNYNSTGTTDASANDEYERMYRGGAKFYYPTATTGYTFKELLIEAHNNRFPNYIFSDIICCGGYNDRENTQANIESAIADFINQAKTYYPYARIYIGHISYNKEGDPTGDASTTGYIANWKTYRNNLKNITLPAYRNCIKYGATYLYNVEYALNEAGLTPSDGYHPNDYGNQCIAKAVAEAFLTGKASIPDKTNSFYFGQKRKKILFLGDSYLEGFTHGTKNEGWGKYCGDALGLITTDERIQGTGGYDPRKADDTHADQSPYDDYERLYIGGIKFSNPSSTISFTSVIQIAHDVKFINYNFTDIVACAGFGDRFYTETEILTGIESFCNTVNELYPNANIYIGHISSIKQGASIGLSDWVTAKNNLLDHVIPAYHQCARYGARYLTNVEYALTDKGLMDDDGYCPNEEGNRSIGIAIANALLTGSAPFPSTHKKYLFLGDAQLAGYSTVSADINNGWGVYCGNALDLSTTVNSTISNGNNDNVDTSSNDDYEILYYYKTSSDVRADGRFGYTDNSEEASFKALIAKAPIKFPRYKFTDIIACGGYGDRAYSSTTILSGIQDFCNKAKQLYPDANIYIGCTAWAASNIENASRISSVVIPTYQKCSQYGARYLNNVQYWIGNSGLSSDGYSTNQTGNKNLGYAIANALRTGSAPLPYKDDYRIS